MEQLLAAGSKIDQEKTLKQLKPLNEQLGMMKVNIEKVKGLLDKTALLKQELKFDIADIDEEIDDLVAKLAGELTLCGIAPNQKATVDSLEAQMEHLKLKGE